MRFRVIQGNPCPESIAPYIELLRRLVAKQGHDATINSIYRGSDARAILHAHGKHDQAEIHRMYPSISNPPGHSSHELRGDGVIGADGERLPEWRQGFDVNDAAVEAWKAAARSHGWTLYQPYSRGAEVHHLGFRHEPHPASTATRARLVFLRHRLPRS